ncbi:MAG: transposase [Microcystis aeruginosa]
MLTGLDHFFSDYVHLIIDYKPDIALSKLIANLKTVRSRLIRVCGKKFFGGAGGV